MLPVTRVIGHKEWAPGRKSDPIYDMNWRRAGVAGVRAQAPPTQRGLFMALSPAQEAVVFEAAQSILFGQAGVRPAGQMASAIDGLRQRLDALLARPAGGQVDPAPIVDAIVRAGIAEQVVDALSHRLAS